MQTSQAGGAGEASTGDQGSGDAAAGQDGTSGVAAEGEDADTISSSRSTAEETE